MSVPKNAQHTESNNLKSPEENSIYLPAQKYASKDIYENLTWGVQKIQKNTLTLSENCAKQKPI